MMVQNLKSTDNTVNRLSHSDHLSLVCDWSGSGSKPPVRNALRHFAGRTKDQQWVILVKLDRALWGNVFWFLLPVISQKQAVTTACCSNKLAQLADCAQSSTCWCLPCYQRSSGPPGDRRWPPELEPGEQPTKQDSADIMIDRGEET